MNSYLGQVNRLWIFDGYLDVYLLSLVVDHLFLERLAKVEFECSSGLVVRVIRSKTALLKFNMLLCCMSVRYGFYGNLHFTCGLGRRWPRAFRFEIEFGDLPNLECGCQTSL